MNDPSIIRENANVIEAMLLRYGDTSSAGRTVTLQLPDDGEHPFRGLKTGASNGQRLALSIALISDDETQADLSVADEPQKPKGGRLAKQAGIACGDKRFWAFLLEEQHGDGDICIFDAEDAARHVKRLCGISSRAQLDHDEIAAAKWRDLHGAFEAWLRE